MIMLLIMSFLVASMLYLLSMVAGSKLKNINKMTSFECGFSHTHSIHGSFSIHFFIILLMFVIFDLEIILIMGCLMSVNTTTFMLVFILMVGGVYLEWYLGKLKWLVSAFIMN